MGNLFKDIGRGLEKTVSWIPHTTAREKRDAMAQTTAQIGYYTEAKNQLINQNKENEQQKSIERARINEKEIRARRNSFRAKTPSAASAVTNEVKSTLG